MSEQLTRDEIDRLMEQGSLWRKEFDDTKLTSKEEDIIYSIYTTKTREEACSILKPIYQKYKTVGMQKKIVQAIYFIIMRECKKVLYADIDIINDWREGKENDGELQILEENGALRRNIKMDYTNKTFKDLGDENSKYQERLGIRPYRDFLMYYYESVRFASVPFRGELFRDIIMEVFRQIEYPMIIDLSGDITVLEDVYYSKREIIRCSDSIVSNFYYVVQYKYEELCDWLLKFAENDKKDLKEVVEQYKNSLDGKRMTVENELQNAMPEKLKQECWDRDEKEKPILTYPFLRDDISTYMAFKYLIVRMYGKKKDVSKIDVKKDMENITEKLKWLSMRLKNTYIACGSMDDVLEKIDGGSVQIAQLGFGRKDDEEAQIVEITGGYYENFADKKKRKKNSKNVERRTKKGLLFFDYCVRKDIKEAVSFAHFINRNECNWVLVCDKEDMVIREMLKADNRYSVEINTSGRFKNFFILAKEDTSIQKILITNVNIEMFESEKINKSEIFNMLMCSLKMEYGEEADKYQKIKIRELTQEYDEDYELDIMYE